MRQAAALVIAGVVVLLAGIAWWVGPPVAMTLAGLALVAGGLFGVDVEPRTVRRRQGRR
ncbi:hypothetical protein [Frankia sp. Cr1]|uniref:hypothetical protein n=1 Tax=Frankia sp. Cr1 TaxID=3073931 RepID=UPI002AD3FC10|nr:hypothetical protein [Frankia sp. Cr1]